MSIMCSGIRNDDFKVKEGKFKDYTVLIISAINWACHYYVKE